LKYGLKGIAVVQESHEFKWGKRAHRKHVWCYQQTKNSPSNAYDALKVESEEQNE